MQSYDHNAPHARTIEHSAKLHSFLMKELAYAQYQQGTSLKSSQLKKKTRCLGFEGLLVALTRGKRAQCGVLCRWLGYTPRDRTNQYGMFPYASLSLQIGLAAKLSHRITPAHRSFFFLNNVKFVTVVFCRDSLLKMFPSCCLICAREKARKSNARSKNLKSNETEVSAKNKEVYKSCIVVYKKITDIRIQSM